MKPINLVEPSETIAGCIDIYDNIIDNASEIIQIADLLNNWQDAAIFNDSTTLTEEINKNIRSNLILPIDQFSYNVEPEFYEMCKTVWYYCNQYAQKYNVGFYATEPAQILKYSPGQYYEPHTDAGTNVPRVISALLYLNDVEQGGETEFLNFDVKVVPKRGRLVIFPSNYAYLHAARPPKNGEKYVAVFWMRG